MEKLDVDPSGPMVLEHLKEHAIGLYNYLMNVKGMINEDYVGKKLMDDIHNHFQVGYKIIWDDYLNQFMVDYDII